MRFHCPYCTRDFTRRAALRNHVKTHDTKVDKALQRIAEEAALEQHEITEVAERESSASSSSNKKQRADMISEGEQEDSNDEWLDVNEVNWFFFCVIQDFTRQIVRFSLKFTTD